MQLHMHLHLLIMRYIRMKYLHASPIKSHRTSKAKPMVTAVKATPATDDLRAAFGTNALSAKTRGMAPSSKSAVNCAQKQRGQV
jgi:hypothetical protein